MTPQFPSKPRCYKGGLLRAKPRDRCRPRPPTMPPSTLSVLLLGLLLASAAAPADAQPAGAAAATANGSGGARPLPATREELCASQPPPVAPAWANVRHKRCGRWAWCRQAVEADVPVNGRCRQLGDSVQTVCMHRPWARRREGQLLPRRMGSTCNPTTARSFKLHLSSAGLLASITIYRH